MRTSIFIVAIGSMTILFGAATCEKSPEKETLRVAFYNVENLFDTIDDPATMDEDFLPNGKYQWNSERYFEKLVNLAAVIDSMMPGVSGPSIVGLCEIENRLVLEDLVAQKNLAANHYGIVHYDSPDARGIDVACLYNTQWLTLQKSEAIDVAPIDMPDFRTRDILFCEFKVKNYNQSLYVYVNHWPSRRGGEEASSHKREAAAAILLSHMKLHIPNYENANILIIGDMNDYPTSKSTYHILGAKEPTQSSFFANLMYTKHEAKQGTYYYNKEWGVIDNVIISAPLQKYTDQDKAVIYKQDWLLYTNKGGETMPKRSYTGSTYHPGGYSDHLPVYVDLQLEK
jgi:predicted extracellular nuclease